MQRLATKGKLAVVVSDDSLAFGVNMPFRTCVFTGQMNGELTPLMAQQMSGRAGRRGLDTQGNLVYVGAPASFIRSLMIGKVSNITGAGHAPRYETCFLQGMLSTRYVCVCMDYSTVSSLAYSLPSHACFPLLLLIYRPFNTTYQQSPIIAHTYPLSPLLSHHFLSLFLHFPSPFLSYSCPFPPLSPFPSPTPRYVGWGRAAVIGGTSLEEFCTSDDQAKGVDKKKEETAVVAAAAGAAGEGNYTLVQSKRALMDLGLIDQSEDGKWRPCRANHITYSSLTVCWELRQYMWESITVVRLIPDLCRFMLPVAHTLSERKNQERISIFVSSFFSIFLPIVDRCPCKPGDTPLAENAYYHAGNYIHIPLLLLGPIFYFYCKPSF